MKTIETKYYLNFEDVMNITGMSRSFAYKEIARTNSLLEREGKMVIPGLIPKDYFMEKHGLVEL